MYNLRYHIASLVAVFLALALGLVLGGLVVQQGSFSQQQRSIVAGLQRDFRRLTDQNADLSADLQFERNYSTQMTDEWVAGRLDGRSVVILTSGAKTEGSGAAISAVSGAGGNPVVVTLVNREFGLDNARTESAVKSIVPTSTDLPGDLAKGLAAEWTTANRPRPFTDALVKAGAIQVTGLHASTAATEVVDVAAFSKKPDAVALGVARAYADAGLFAVGAQTLASGTGVASAAAQLKLSAFDTLGTQAGRFTLVALFSGGEQGYFGRAPGVDKPFPAMPVP